MKNKEMEVDPLFEVAARLGICWESFVKDVDAQFKTKPKEDWLGSNNDQVHKILAQAAEFN